MFGKNNSSIFFLLECYVLFPRLVREIFFESHAVWGKETAVFDRRMPTATLFDPDTCAEEEKRMVVGGGWSLYDRYWAEQNARVGSKSLPLPCSIFPNTECEVPPRCKEAKIQNFVEFPDWETARFEKRSRFLAFMLGGGEKECPAGSISSSWYFLLLPFKRPVPPATFPSSKKNSTFGLSAVAATTTTAIHVCLPRLGHSLLPCPHAYSTASTTRSVCSSRPIGMDGMASEAEAAEV